ncbi:hypothetical protein [Paenibacillus sp. MMS20-IR301]|uniref:hypothetical protein n=1 Tax=Paenibacillus sp. MMS20-IR301 TaxID=2895946 RepID=UPI0028E4572A|nr:hypothetical protein [Paenibacillus sp. MMS20-IR301]WNS45581.1 hypothetical protein LOS79_10020 [Paenibacillus sp. MMS20-IR301]
MKKPDRSRLTNQLYRILLFLFIAAGCAGLSPDSAAHAAQTGEITPVVKLFPALERVRTEVKFTLSYPDNNFHINVAVKQTSFDTGEVIMNFYDYDDPALKSKYKLSETEMRAISYLTPAGPKSYIAVEAWESSNYLGSTIYEFDLGSKQLKKITDISNKFRVQVYGSLGVYETIHNELTTAYNGIDKHQLYSLQTNKPVLPQGKYGLIERMTLQKNAGAKSLETTDYVLREQALTGKGAIKIYLLAYGGKLTQVPAIYNKFTYDQNKDISNLVLANGNGQLQLKRSLKSGQEYSKLTLIKGNTTKVLLDVPGYINESSMPSFSPSNRYMIITSQIRGAHLAFADATYYIFDLKTMTVIHKLKPHYKLYEIGIEWFTDELFLITYDTSRPNTYKPVYYHVPTQTSIPDEELIEYNSYIHNFTYDGLLSLNAPIPLQVDQQYIRYSGNGPLMDKETYYIPLADFAEQQGITVNITASGLQLSKGDSQISIGVKDALKLGSTWYVPLKKLVPLGYTISWAGSDGIIMNTAAGTN